VKNTFIEGFVDDSDEEAEDGLPMVATTSCPAVRVPASLWTTQSAEAPVATKDGTLRGYLVQYLSSSRDLAPGALSSDDGAKLFEARRSQASTRSSSFDRHFDKLVTSTVSVKNTFIEGFVDDSDEEAEDGLPMVATKSCPAVRMPASLWICEPTTQQQHDAVLTQHEQHPPVPSCPSMGPQVMRPLQRDVAAQADTVMPLAVRQPAMSVGSVLHEAGQCKPCAWFWRPQGCENGAECRHCHLCGAGEIKARRKAKAVSLRTKGAGERRPPHDSKLMRL